MSTSPYSIYEQMDVINGTGDEEDDKFELQVVVLRRDICRCYT